MDIYQELEARGIIKQVTDPALKDVLNQGPLTLYAGFDPTSDSLHVGSLLPIITLSRFQRAGHRVTAVMGGATGMIGDPSGKSQERSLLTEAQIDQNLKGIKRVFEKYLDLSGSNPALIVNNADWFKNLSFVDFLRDVGKHFTVNHMMAKESIRARLEDREHGISYTEFSYMLLQAYDFLVLHDRENCRLQIGGSDQWGNITAGGELIRRVRAHRGKPATSTEEVYGLTHPLVTKSDGTKFGKTEQGTVWLSADKTSPYQFYQFFIQTSDTDVMTYLKFFSFKSLEEIAELEKSLKAEPEKRLAQRALAREMTLLTHGQQALEQAEKASSALFSAEIKDLDQKTLLELFSGAPSTQKPKDALSAGYTLVDALVDTGLCSSKGSARKEITAGGIYLNNVRVSDPAALLRSEDLIASQYVVLRKGKKTYHLVSFLDGAEDRNRTGTSR